MSKVAVPPVLVIVTALNSTLETGASGTAQKMPGPWAPDAVEAVMLLKVILSQ